MKTPFPQVNPLSQKLMQAEIDELRAKLAALESQEPVAEVMLSEGEKIIDASMAFFDSSPVGTLLYAAAGAAIKEVVVHADYKVMWQQVTKSNQELCAALAAGAAPVPEGWQLVPVEPTQEMLFAAMNVDLSMSDTLGACIDQWQVMLAAAPKELT